MLAVPLAELVPLVRRQLRGWTPWPAVYWAFNAAGLAWLGYRSYQAWPAWQAVLAGVGQDFFGFFLLLLPLHEALHAAAYKLLGAPRVRFGAE